MKNIFNHRLPFWMALVMAGAWLSLSGRMQAEEIKLIHVLVALCDNQSQGIAPVPARIGNGDDPARNLYWGCDDGTRSVFRRSPVWVQDPGSGVDPDGDGPILERLTFRHKIQKAILVADAYRGREIKICLEDFYRALAGNRPLKLSADSALDLPTKPADLVVYVGHNGLMDFVVSLPGSPAKPESPRSAMIFCCISANYFGPVLHKTGVAPLILTRQLMYPAAQLVHEGVAGWLAGESAKACISRASQAYARNQKISVKAAAGVFTSVPNP